MKKTYRIAAIPGDGIGHEVMPEGINVLQAAALRWDLDISFENIEWASCEYYQHHGQMMPNDWQRQLQCFDAIYLVRLAGLRPCQTTFRCGGRC